MGQYKNGFGYVGGNFCLGNDLLHQITSRGTYEIRVDMQDFEGEHRYAYYNHFQIEAEDENYRLTVGVYSGNAGKQLYFDVTEITLSWHNNYKIKMIIKCLCINE